MAKGFAEQMDFSGLSYAMSVIQIGIIQPVSLAPNHVSHSPTSVN